jgi:hypothetical protein
MRKPELTTMRIFLFLAGFFLMFGVSGAAQAQSCNEDIAAMGKKRNSSIEMLQKISQAHGGKLDPIAACPPLRNLKTVESEMLAYLVKNKEWCNIPDDFIANFRSNTEKTGKTATQACGLAEKMKKMQENGGFAAGGGNLPPPPKLPAGPL